MMYKVGSRGLCTINNCGRSNIHNHPCIITLVYTGAVGSTFRYDVLLQGKSPWGNNGIVAISESEFKILETKNLSKFYKGVKYEGI